MAQNIFSFKLEEAGKDTSLTSYAGIPLVYELYHKLGLPHLINKQVKVKEAGWKESELVEAIVGLSVAGGDHMEDVRMLLSDIALANLVEKKQEPFHGDEVPKNQEGLFPSAKALERFLKRFHGEEKKPEGIDAWVPQETKPLKKLAKVVYSKTAKRLIEASGLKTVTIENDATAVFSHKEEALGTYKGGTGYMPVIGSIAELGVVVGDEFRDGNVPPAFKVKKFFKECLKAIPKSVLKVCARLDGAYYDHDFIAYLNNEDKPFGVIDFTITGKKSPSIIEWIEALPQSDWKPLMRMTANGPVPSGREWAEMPWTSAEGTRKTMRERMLRTLITRKTEEQWELFKEKAIEEATKKDRYEVIHSNRDWSGDRLIRWHYERGGSIEHIHDRIKNDLAGGILPCAEFGANAAWWRIQCLTWNLLRALQLHALPEELRNCHLKRLRFQLLCIAGKVVKHARNIILKLTQGHPSYTIYKQARERIAGLVFAT